MKLDDWTFLPHYKLVVIFMIFVKLVDRVQDGKPITVYKGYNLISSAKFREEIRQDLALEKQ